MKKTFFLIVLIAFSGCTQNSQPKKIDLQEIDRVWISTTNSLPEKKDFLIDLNQKKFKQPIIYSTAKKRFNEKILETENEKEKKIFFLEKEIASFLETRNKILEKNPVKLLSNFSAFLLGENKCDKTQELESIEELLKEIEKLSIKAENVLNAYNQVPYKEKIGFRLEWIELKKLREQKSFLEKILSTRLSLCSSLNSVTLINTEVSKQICSSETLEKINTALKEFEAIQKIFGELNKLSEDKKLTELFNEALKEKEELEGLKIQLKMECDN